MRGKLQLTEEAEPQTWLVEGWLEKLGLGDATAWLAPWIATLALVVLISLVHLLLRRPLLRLLHKLISVTRVKWDDRLVQHGVFRSLSHFLPAMLLYAVPPLFFPEDHDFPPVLQRFALAYMTVAGAFGINALLAAMLDLLPSLSRTQGRPIRSFFQVARLLVWLTAAVLAISMVMDRSPWAFLTGLGAMTAVLLLVFKDSILGLVASIQLSAYDMIRVGDWIEMPSHGADGDVMEISLTTVKVRNWDKTITTIPTYALVGQAFKNWRGMADSGGRRIKRSLFLDMQSIAFVDEAMLKRLQKIRLLQTYLQQKAQEVSEWNQKQENDMSCLVNGRRLTNVGTFRAYVQAYLKQHPAIHSDMTFLVRQLAPGPKGLPLEIYVFSREQRWTFYEGIQADIFDHMLAVVPEFGLRLFQEPTGADWAMAASGSHHRVGHQQAGDDGNGQ
ncbi:MAG: mechanosensitive ion channel family protein [Planctomycetota bacterium]|nr:MAG: mechanosensitive ion channel family protein [Planctomycetota bacterium]